MFRKKKHENGIARNIRVVGDRVWNNIAGKMGGKKYMKIQAVRKFQNEICTSRFSVGKDIIITNCVHCTCHLNGIRKIQKSEIHFFLHVTQNFLNSLPF